MPIEYDEKYVEQVKKQAFKTAFRFHQEARDEGDFVKYERAAYYYELAGEWAKAEHCQAVARTLKNEQTA